MVRGDGGLTCLWAPNDNNVIFVVVVVVAIVIVVMLLSLTVGPYGGGWRSLGWFWRW